MDYHHQLLKIALSHCSAFTDATWTIVSLWEDEAPDMGRIDDEIQALCQIATTYQFERNKLEKDIARQRGTRTAEEV